MTVVAPLATVSGVSFIDLPSVQTVPYCRRCREIDPNCEAINERPSADGQFILVDGFSCDRCGEMVVEWPRDEAEAESAGYLMFCPDCLAAPPECKCPPTNVEGAGANHDKTEPCCPAECPCLSISCCKPKAANLASQKGAK